MSGREYFVLLAVTMDLQRAQEVDEIPRVVRLDDVGKRRHRRAIDAGHEDLVDILIGRAALETGIVSAVGEVVGANRLIFAVGER